MNSIRLSHYPKHFGVKTEVNGVELQEVVEVNLECPLDGLPRLTVVQNVYPDLDVTLNAIVYPRLNIIDTSLELMVEHISSTQTRYWARKKETL